MENLRKNLEARTRANTGLPQLGNGQGKIFLRSGKRQGVLLWFRQNIDNLREVRGSWNLTALISLCQRLKEKFQVTIISGFLFVCKQPFLVKYTKKNKLCIAIQLRF